MKNRDNITPNTRDYCLVLEGEIYAIYFPAGGKTELDLSGHAGNFDINWFNPRKGGGLEFGTKTQVPGGHMIDIGLPPADPEKDWVALVVYNGI
jgi:hypothetical protein